MTNITIFKLSELDDDYKERAVELYLDGFGYLFSFTKKRSALKDLFLSSIDFSMIYVALSQDNIVGYIAVSNNKRRPVSFKTQKYKQLFGNLRGRVIQKLISRRMEKPAVQGEKDLYIDYLVTNKKHRGQGIATQLIKYVWNDLEYDECYIEVLSKNTNAKKLYEHLGFVVFKKNYNYYTIVRGFGYLIKLRCKLLVE